MSKFSSFLKRIREKHTLSYSDEGNYDEKWSLKVSTLNILSLLAFYTIVTLFLFFLLLKFTGIGNIFETSSDQANMDQVHKNASSIDSLYEATASTDLYLRDLKKILNDEPFYDSLETAQPDSFPSNYQPDFEKSVEDSILRAKMENDEIPDQELLNVAFFFPPVKGVVSRSFDPNNKHYGVDISTPEDAVVKSCLEGIVIYTGWDSEVGQVIIVQHNYGFLSVYKHCSKIFKKQGQSIQTGDPIALVGNTGSHSSGPHLHFELWEKGQYLNPEDFISFNR
ncbi:MAG: M23 family metallopeptidase [Crocinitomicaceae bacterium]|nr:M23 family metallopeptidase [Crocinitomicaceae bacterium]